MKILFLGYLDCKLLDFLSSNYDVTQTMDKISSIFVNEFDQIVSFGYSHIIGSNIIDNIKNPIINLHISYLPYNRGCHPNFWSFLDNTPKGVTIHLIDKGIDTGNILLQKEVKFESGEDTLFKTYNKLIEEIQNLFIDNHIDLLQNNIPPKPQIGNGTFHYRKDLKKYKDLLTEGWDTQLNKIKNGK